MNEKLLAETSYIKWRATVPRTERFHLFYGQCVTGHFEEPREKVYKVFNTFSLSGTAQGEGLEKLLPPDF